MEGIDSPDVTRLKSRATHPLIGRIIAERFQIASFIGDGRIAQVRGMLRGTLTALGRRNQADAGFSAMRAGS